MAIPLHAGVNGQGKVRVRVRGAVAALVRKVLLFNWASRLKPPSMLGRVRQVLGVYGAELPVRVGRKLVPLVLVWATPASVVTMTPLLLRGTNDLLGVLRTQEAVSYIDTSAQPDSSKPREQQHLTHSQCLCLKCDDRRRQFPRPQPFP